MEKILLTYLIPFLLRVWDRAKKKESKKFTALYKTTNTSIFISYVTTGKKE